MTEYRKWKWLVKDSCIVKILQQKKERKKKQNKKQALDNNVFSFQMNYNHPTWPDGLPNS